MYCGDCFIVQTNGHTNRTNSAFQVWHVRQLCSKLCYTLVNPSSTILGRTIGQYAQTTRCSQHPTVQAWRSNDCIPPRQSSKGCERFLHTIPKSLSSHQHVHPVTAT